MLSIWRSASHFSPHYIPFTTSYSYFGSSVRAEQHPSMIHILLSSQHLSISVSLPPIKLMAKFHIHGPGDVKQQQQVQNECGSSGSLITVSSGELSSGSSDAQARASCLRTVWSFPLWLSPPVTKGNGVWPAIPLSGRSRGSIVEHMICMKKFTSSIPGIFGLSHLKTQIPVWNPEESLPAVSTVMSYIDQWSDGQPNPRLPRGVEAPKCILRVLQQPPEPPHGKGIVNPLPK